MWMYRQARTGPHSFSTLKISQLLKFQMTHPQVPPPVFFFFTDKNYLSDVH